MDIPRFHLAFPVRDLTEARAFYGDLLGCPEGRSSREWVDFDFHGHQIVAHLSPGETAAKSTSPVGRSEERRVGKECPSKCRSRWSPYH